MPPDRRAWWLWRADGSAAARGDISDDRPTADLRRDRPGAGRHIAPDHRGCRHRGTDAAAVAFAFTARPAYQGLAPPGAAAFAET